MNIVTVDLGASMVSSAARDTDRKKNSNADVLSSTGSQMSPIDKMSRL